MGNRLNIAKVRVGTTRLCAGENKGIKTPQKLADYVKAQAGKTATPHIINKNSQEK